jgi:hypothetical protein
VAHGQQTQAQPVQPPPPPFQSQAAQQAHYQLSSPSSPGLPPYVAQQHDPSAAQQQQQGQDPTRAAIKRKDGPDASSVVSKRSRKAEDGEEDEDAGAGAGLKHWTDEDKTKLFTWLMGPGQDEHFNSLRASKNSCLREVRSFY